MHQFNFETTALHAQQIEEVTYLRLAKSIGTPFYAYSCAQLKHDLQKLMSTMPEELNFLYSLKANPNMSLVNVIHQQGVGCEVCSLTELETALCAGASARDIIFVGPGKSDSELARCVDLGIKAVVVESLGELQRLETMAAQTGKSQAFAFRINPNFTSEKARLVMSGKPRQFGIDEDVVINALNHLDRYPHLTLAGIHVYLGTRILLAEAVIDNTRNILSLAEHIEAKLSHPLSFVDIGGGLGIPYYPKEQFLDLDATAQGLAPLITQFQANHPDTRLIMELGRYIVARAGIFVTTVRDIKSSKGKTFAICDGGSNCHGAAAGIAIRKNFPIKRLGAASDAEHSEDYMITGPLCTPTDLIGNAVTLPQLQVGDLIGVFHSGAYGPTASPVNFLSFGQPAEVLIDGDTAIQIRQPEHLKHVLAQQLPMPVQLVSATHSAVK
ncbi:diaminopimelate decarboxylase [Xenorhabdus vietnamensis]|uniref:Diaminopimelate decarboxylase n=1 Tax=Xenorhabdus vietnamensis TaxID=351656 RepID=A0A1Y2S9F0_9GAMM|nr:type III PLP-dependent enzyme [Xenorhabdus vietnamensis]OTA14536.1 diaminopimelate decarboxylase [Xenorhabdus vietnamensis]